VTDRLDFMFAEVDRQLEEVREQCNAVATRVGLLISASAVSATVLVANLDEIKGGEITAFVLLGVSTLVGILALLPGLEIGPEPFRVSSWAVSHPPNQAVTALFDAKQLSLVANRRRLDFMARAFYLQVGVVIAAIVAALLAAGVR
jgi:hypothetical protein